MLFFRRVMRKLGNKLLWFPQLMTVGKPADTEELAGRLSPTRRNWPGGCPPYPP